MTFEEAIPVIDNELAKRRGKWRLNALSHLDFDDVCQIIRAHIFQKWDQYNPERPLVNWLNKTITHQMFNIMRDNYGRFAPPCNNCNYNEGEDRCGMTDSQTKCSECPLYAQWEVSKRDGYNVILASSTDDPDYIESEYSSLSPDESDDKEKSVEKIVDAMREKLHPLDFQIFKESFIDGKTDEEIASGILLRDKTLKGKCKYVKDRKKLIIKEGKKVILDGDY